MNAEFKYKNAFKINKKLKTKGKNVDLLIFPIFAA